MRSVIEDVAVAVRDWIAEALPAQLAKLEGGYGGDVKLALPVQVVMTQRDPYGWADYPVVLIVPERADFEEMATGLDEMRVTLGIVLGLAEGNPDQMASVCLRYSEAIRALCRDDWTVGGSVDSIRLDAVEYVPALPGDIAVHVVVMSATAVKAIPNHE